MKKKNIITIIGIVVMIILIIVVLVVILKKDKKEDENIVIGEHYTDELLFANDMQKYTNDNLPKEYLNKDFDQDGLSNKKEIELGTDMYKIDTDDDGLNDYEEINKTKTDPTKWSSRDDGISDLEYTVADSANFKEEYSSLDASGFRVYLKNPNDKLFIIKKVKTSAFDKLETISEPYEIKYFSGKMALDCSKYISEVANSITIYKVDGNEAKLVENTIEANNYISFEVKEGDIFVAVYSGDYE